MTWLLGFAIGAGFWFSICFGVHLLFMQAERRRAAQARYGVRLARYGGRR